jgi:hypothetical protein
VDNFTPDSGKLNFAVEIEDRGRLVFPVVGWTIVNGSLEAVVMVNGRVFVTVTEYLEALSSKATTTKTMFEQVQPLAPEVSPPKRPTPEYDR